MSSTITHKEAFELNVIDIKTVRKCAPSAFTELKAPGVSDDYVVYNTPRVLEYLIERDWLPIEAYEVKPKLEKNKGFQKHFIRFRNENKFIGTRDAIEAIPELLFINSYDGRCAARLQTTITRVCCNNNIIVTSEGIEPLVMTHAAAADADKAVMDHLCYPVEKNIKLSIEIMGRFKQFHLDKNLKRKLATECLRARWDYKYQLTDISQLLYPIRDEDEGDDMWTVSNIIQEKLVRGGWTGSGGRLIKGMKDRNRELKINQKLSPILESFYSTVHSRSNK